MNHDKNYYIENPIHDDVDKWLMEHEVDWSIIKAYIQKHNIISGEDLNLLIKDDFYY